MDLTKVTRITVVQYPEGRVFERKNLYDNGVELSVQDDGRTLKIFPRQKEGQIMLDETRDALIAQQQMMQTSLNEAIREVSERVWAEGFSAGWDRGHYESGDETNPYKENA